MARRIGRRTLLGLAMRAFLGRLAKNELNTLEGEELWVRTGTRWVNVSTDGEVSVMDEPLRYRISPNALSVLVMPSNDWVA
jgi:diacylglycerol kinase family enzyme